MRTFKKITMNEFKDSLWEKFKFNCLHGVMLGYGHELDSCDECGKAPTNVTDYINGLCEHCIVYLDSFYDITPQVLKDLSKVDFETENLDADPRQNEVMCSGMVGFHTTRSGLPFLGFEACGDGEHPIIFIIYHDGEQLRGYIPDKGNVYDRKNNKAYHYEEDNLPNHDSHLMLEDIENNIQEVI